MASGEVANVGFLNPLFFSLTFFIGVFILLYFFRKQFETKLIPSNMLWEQVMKEWEAHPFFDRLQKNLLFWLQLFALVLLMFALVRPFWYTDGVRGDDIIFVVDTSASMAADSDGRSLFDHHKDTMKKIISSLDDEEMTIILAGERPDVILRKSTNKNEMNEIIDSLEVSYQHENLGLSLSLANSLANESTEIHLFSDGALREMVEETVPSHYLEVHNNPSSLQNISLKSFGVGQADDGIGAIAVIENKGASMVKVPFQLSGENKLLFEESYEIDAFEEQLVFIENLQEFDYYRAKIQVRDQYAVDNSQAAVLLNESPPVYAIGEVNPFYVRGFESIGMDVTQLSMDDIDLIENDGIIITSDKGLLTHPTHPTIYTENDDNTTIELSSTVEMVDDPLLEYVNLSNVFIQKATTQAIPQLQTIANSGDIALIQKGIRNSYPLIVIHFPISKSDWPLHANFPIFLFNSYQWIQHQSSFLGHFQPGEERWINIGGESNKVDIFDENNKNLYSINVQEASFKAPSTPGLYQALSGDNIYYFSVVLDERERNVVSSESYIINQEFLKENERKNHTMIKDNLWFWLTLCAVILLAAEWEVYRRYASI